MKVAVYHLGEKIRERDFYQNEHVLDVSGVHPISPEDGEQKVLKVVGGSPTATFTLMFSDFLGGWVSSVNHPAYLPDQDHQVRLIDENTKVTKVA